MDVGLIMLLDGPRGDQAREALGQVLGDGSSIGQVDDVGVFTASVDAIDREQALQRVWDGIAAAGVDDEIAFVEHPELPEHWRHRARRPGEPSDRPPAERPGAEGERRRARSYDSRTDQPSA
jgi:hypothetical protein